MRELWGSGWESLALVVLRTAVVYVAVLVGLRLAGKREVGQMTPFDLVLLLLLSNAVQNAMVGPDSSVTGGLLAAGTLLLLNTTLGRWAARNRSVGRLLRGEPCVLILDGHVREDNLRHEGLRIDDVLQALREHGITAIPDVYLATLEVDGSISVIKKEEFNGLPHKPHRRIRMHRVS